MTHRIFMTRYFFIATVLLFVCTNCGGSATSEDVISDAAPKSDMKGGEDFVPPGQLDSGEPFDGVLAPITGAELSLVVHIDKEETPYRNLMGVNKPAKFSEKAPGTKVYDASQLYKYFGIRQVRLHDSKLDVCHIYQDDNLIDATQEPPAPLTECKNEPGDQAPHVVWAVNDPADMDNPDNYDYETYVLPLLESVAKSGAQPYFRLGESYNGPNDVQQPEAYAHIATNIFKEILEQWLPATLDNTPHYVEVFNEPDGMFWRGDNEAFYTLVRDTIDGVKAVASNQGASVRVGSAGFVHKIVENLDLEGNVAQGFIEAVGADRLDFFSAHYYGACQDEKAEDGWNWLSSLRNKLNERGLQDKPLHITEWNVSIGSACPNEYFSAQEVQAFTGFMLTMMQDHFLNVEAAHFYAGIPNMGLFTVDEDQRFVVRPSAWSFWAHSLLQGGTILRAEVCGTDSCYPAGSTTNFNVMGTSVRKGNTVYALLTNLTKNPKDLIVRFKGLDLTNATVRFHRPPKFEDGAVVVDSELVEGVIQPTLDGVENLAALISIDEPALQLDMQQADSVVSVPGHTVAVVELTIPE